MFHRPQHSHHDSDAGSFTLPTLIAAALLLHLILLAVFEHLSG